MAKINSLQVYVHNTTNNMYLANTTLPMSHKELPSCWVILK